VSSFEVALSIAFNLLVNAMGSFLVAAGLASLAAWLLRVRAGRWKQFFLAVPLAKLAWNLVRGVPRESFFWAKLAGVRQDKGWFQVGIGLDHVVPVLNLQLGAVKNGTRHPQSWAELFATFLSRRVGAPAPAVVAVAVLAVSAALLAMRVAGLSRTVRAEKRLRRNARVVELTAHRRRPVDVVVADEYEGVPFLGGLSRPYVCFSRSVHESLSVPERDAVVRHELGHLANHDLLLFITLGLFEDLFWFVPLLRRRCAAVRAEAEDCADRWALAAGASAIALAAALVRVTELSRTSPAPALGLLRGESLLSRRVHGLLAASRSASAPGRVRLGLLAIAWRVIATACVAVTIFESTTMGNR
jgi:beta-lactamase regulating signal transducer with metallopeptidase domain